MRFYRNLQKKSLSGKLGLETKLKSSDGKLIGRPDYFYISGTRAVLRELKSSSLRNNDKQIRDDYLDQIKFYALLLFESFPIETVDATLESSRGEHLEYSFSFSDVEPIKSLALNALNKANTTISKVKVASDLATPSSTACRSCEKRIICDAFKRVQHSLGIEGDAFVLEGKVEGLNRKINGKVFEVSIKEEISGNRYSLVLPEAEGSEIAIGKQYLFSDLVFQGGRFRWSEHARVFACD